jgi:predicted NAD-dependent protein-ADP-ribosyltransferase YbiA (DUF1768 family)
MSKSDKALLEKEVITFFSGKKEFRSLSNFWEFSVIVGNKKDKREYETGEHCFHGEKYLRLGRICNDTKRKRELIMYGLTFVKPSKYKTAVDAKKNGGKNGLLLTSSELDDWSILSIYVQYEICKYKFDTYQEVKDDLIKSNNKILVHPALRTSEEKIEKRTWEGKAIIKDGQIEIIGKNMLGNTWIEIRTKI